MSQAGAIASTGGVGPTVVETLTGNSGGPVGPTGNNINVVGDGTSVTVAGNPGTSTLTISLVGGVPAIEEVNVQTGTSPVTPTAGAITLNGAVVAAGTNPVRTDGTASDTIAVEVQTTQAIAGTDATKIGLAAFDSAFFTADANGFVSLNGSAVGETITGDTGGPLSPTAGNWNILGSSVAAGSTPVATSGAVSTLTVDVQTSQAIAASDATKIGLCAFDSASFTVDANGFVQPITSGSGTNFNMQTGTSPVVPSAGAITFDGAVVAAGTNPVRTDGTGANTMALEVQISQAIAATDATKIGLAAFDSAKFTVDANGFVSLTGGGGSTPSLSPYIVGTAGVNDFATIQGAINQAVTDGHASGNPANVYIKPGTYVEDLALADGVNLIGFTPSNIANGNPSVTINGSMTFSSTGAVQINNVILSASAAALYTSNGAFINCSITFYNCQLTGNQTVIDVRGGGTQTVNFQYSTIDSSGKFFHTDTGVNTNVNLFLEGSTENCGDTVSQGGTPIIFTANNSTTNFTVDNTGHAVIFTFTKCNITNATDLVKSSLGAGSNILTLQYCKITSAGRLCTLSSNASVLRFENCIFVNGFPTYSVVTQVISGGNIDELGNAFYPKPYVGFANSQAVQSTDFLDTNGTGIMETIATIIQPTNGSTTVYVNVVGNQSDFTDTTGGNVIATFNCQAGVNTVVGAPVKNKFATSTGDFQVVADGAGNILIQVQDIGVVAYDWVINYTYQSVVSSA